MAAPIRNDWSSKLKKIKQVQTTITTKLAHLHNMTMNNAFGDDSKNATQPNNNNNNTNAMYALVNCNALVSECPSPLMPELLDKQQTMPPTLPSLMSLSIAMPMSKKSRPLPTPSPTKKPQNTKASKRAQNMAILAQPVPNFVPHISDERSQLQERCTWAMVARRKNPLPDKPPAFFLPLPQNQNALLPVLMREVGNPLVHYYLARLRNGLTQITAKTMDIYAKIKSTLESNKYAYFTHQPRWERGARFAILNLHHSTPIEVIRQQLQELGFEAKFIKGLTNFKTRRPMNVFLIEIKKQEADKHNEILKVKVLGCQEIRIERQRGRNTLPQCVNCLLFGHTAKYCRLPSLCRICAGPHHVSKCSSDGQLPKCGNCGGGHRATYRGCAYFKAELAKFLVDQRPFQRKRQQQHKIKQNWLYKSTNNYTHSPVNRHSSAAAPCPAPNRPSRPEIQSATSETKNKLKSTSKSPKNLINLPENPRLLAPASTAPCPSSIGPSPRPQRQAYRPTSPSAASEIKNKLKSAPKSSKNSPVNPANFLQSPAATASRPSGHLAKAAPENNKKSTKNQSNLNKYISKAQLQPLTDPTEAPSTSSAVSLGPSIGPNRHKAAPVPEKNTKILKYAIKPKNYSPANQSLPAATHSSTPDAPENGEKSKLNATLNFNKTKSHQYLPNNSTRPSASHKVYSPGPENKNELKHQPKIYSPASSWPRPISFTLSSPEPSTDDESATFLK